METVSKGVPFQITDPERIPVERYYDEGFYKLECERLWPHVWQMACRLEQIPNVGDWLEYSNLGKSLIIVRTKDGVKAYHNACRHRGVQLVSGHGNCKVQGFTCPFHGWRYNLEGKNTFVYAKHMFSERQLDQADLALAPCRVELWGGCVFINFDDKARPLREGMGGLAERFEAHGLDKLRAEWWYATVLPANWKVAMEAFMESYHVAKTHPQLLSACASIYNSMYGQYSGAAVNPNQSARDNIRAQFKHMELVGQGMAGMVHAKEIEIARQLLDVDLPEDPQQAVMTWYGIVQDQITKQLGARGEPVPDLNAVAVSAPLKAVEFIFPHFFLLPFFSSMASYRIRPLGPESCLFEIWSLTMFPAGEEPAPVMQPVVLAHDSPEFPPIPQQDYSNIPRQQIGLHAGGFKFMRLSKDIEGLISNYQQLIDEHLQCAPPHRLSKAMAALSGGFDGPILDMAS